MLSPHKKRSRKKKGKKKYIDGQKGIIERYEYSSINKIIENDNEYADYRHENKNGNIKAELHYQNKLTGYDYVVKQKGDKFEKIENQERSLEDQQHLNVLQKQRFLPPDDDLSLSSSDTKFLGS